MRSEYLRKNLAEKDIHHLLSKYNSNFEDYFRWKKYKSKTDCIDMFGNEINENDSYYLLRIGGGYDYDLKMSEVSMERFLYAIFAAHPKWESKIRKAKKNSLKDVKDIINELDNNR